MATSEIDDAALFRGLQFFLTRSLSREVADEIQDLIEQHGGVVSSSSAGATQLVDYEELDSRSPDWVSIDYIKDSVALGALQDPAKYSGIVFNSKPTQLHAKGRVHYSVEDDARLLHFAKLQGWTSTDSVPPSVWKAAENEHVTNHSWQSMYERFKKQLRNKTPKEQRAIMARASEIIRTRLQRQEVDEEEKEQNATRASPSTADRRASVTPPRAAAREAPPTPATSSLPPRRQNGERTRQKRKRGVPSSVIAASSPATREDEEKDNEIHHDEADGAYGVSFISVWTELAKNPSKRARMQAFFHASTEEWSRQTEASINESVDSDSRGDEAPAEALAQEGRNDINGGQQQAREVELQLATDAETDEIICQLQLETNQDTPCVVHALYYCSGDSDMAREFLKGASPSGMWSPEDDLLLVDLVVDEDIDRAAVDAAVARGDFESMQVPRDTDAVLDRVQFLR